MNRVILRFLRIEVGSPNSYTSVYLYVKRSGGYTSSYLPLRTVLLHRTLVELTERYSSTSWTLYLSSRETPEVTARLPQDVSERKGGTLRSTTVYGRLLSDEIHLKDTDGNSLQDHSLVDLRLGPRL